MLRKFLVLAVLVSSISVAQEKGKEKKVEPVFHQVSNKDIVQSVYPNAVKVDKIDDFWYRILDANNKTIAFAMSSAPFCKRVIGYHNTTPVLLITDKKFVIQKVAILSNWETLAYVRKLEKNGFFDLWNGKHLKSAKDTKLDAYTGATLTADAVKINVDFLLTQGMKKLPKSN